MKIVLMSRDEKSMLVVSYHDLKKALNEAYSELLKPATGAGSSTGGGSGGAWHPARN